MPRLHHPIHLFLIPLPAIAFLCGCTSHHPPSPAAIIQCPRTPDATLPISFQFVSLTQGHGPNPANETTVWIINQIGYKPVTIQRVRFDGLRDAQLADQSGRAYAPSFRTLPVTLNQKDSLTLFQYGPSDANPRTIKYLLIETDQGTYRHDVAAQAQPAEK